MLLELEKAIAPDAKAEIRIYAGGCDIRVCWNGGLRQANQSLDAQQLSHIEEFRDEKMDRAWEKLIKRFQDMKARPKLPIEPGCES